MQFDEVFKETKLRVFSKQPQEFLSKMFLSHSLFFKKWHLNTTCSIVSDDYKLKNAKVSVFPYFSVANKLSFYSQH